jgi:hypothetical protein
MALMTVRFVSANPAVMSAIFFAEISEKGGEVL